MNKNHFRTVGWLCALGLVLSTAARAQGNDWNGRNGLAEDKAGNNLALLVGAPNGLPGVDHDLSNMKTITTNTEYQFKPTSLFQEEAHKDALLKNLTDLSRQVGEKGTFLFYFSGHGNTDIIAAEGMEIVNSSEMRSAIEKGRDGVGPLQRLVLMFDSCMSGSMLDPFRRFRFASLTPSEASTSFADAIVREFKSSNARASYWQKLFVFASSRADEESEGDDGGGIFTEAMTKAFPEVIDSGTVADFVSKTKTYTGDAQHPVARYVPEALGSERMKGNQP